MRVEIKKNTDQLNYEDFLGGLIRIVTIADVKPGAKEAQYDIAIESDARFWRPPPTVLKMLIKAWGDDAAQWVGRRAELYGDPNVDSPAMKKAGGIRVSRVSHIDAPVSEMLQITRGKKARFTLDPLPDAPPPNPNAARLAELKAEWDAGPTEERKAEITAEVQALQAGGRP
ncbi:hypothetical protein [Nocardioides terrigena]|uniref:hypothetical protein n=1 Tax=Nocardioides terrigena TaxID=424797 RepID=UPI000D2F4E0D|nr:hypothetical protein [Nocardioides terrigena]